MISIKQVTGLATIQDQGRSGWGSLGISTAGAMDKFALTVGNTLLKNPIESPAIELALAGIKITFTTSCFIIITGAAIKGTIDNNPINSYWIYQVNPGQELVVSQVVKGMYAYICFSKQLDIVPLLNSASTDSNAKFGGLNGNPLSAGDQIKLIENNKHLNLFGVAPIKYSDTIRIVKSSEYKLLTPKSKIKLYENVWQVLTSSNRMGNRIKSLRPLKLQQAVEMLSHAVAPGIIQLTPDGQLIVLNSNCQTTGGYPKVAAVITADLGNFAQLRYGTNFQFKLVTHEQTLVALKHQDNYLKQIEYLVKNRHPY